jgi:CRISPR-associated protein Cas2
VFQCRLSAQRHAELIALLDGIIHHNLDHVILVDVGIADQVAPRIVSLGKAYLPLERGPLIV